MSVTVRDITAADEARWRELWTGYCEFYHTDMPTEITDDTWRRLLDDGTPDMFSLLACDEGGTVIGFTNCVLHPNTWAKAPMCYLEDLFVAPEARNSGAGRALIEAVRERGQSEGWRHIYWRTANDNATARALYDKVAKGSNWITYEIGL